MTPSNMTEQESMAIIRGMIAQAKDNFRDNGFYYLLWGWATVFGAVGHFILMKVWNPMYAPIVWLIVPIVGLIGTFSQIKKREKNSRVRTHLEHLTQFLWAGIGCCFFIILGVTFTQVIDFKVAYPLFIMFMGLGTFISGGVLRFYPLMIGGIVAWIIAVIAFFVEFETQLLLIGLGVISAYLVPGYLLKRRD